MTDWDSTRRRHGTESGWSLHQQLDERPCDACYAAKQRADRRRAVAPAKVRRSRLNAKAQNLAYSALAHKYPDEYAALYQQNKAELFSDEASA